MIERHFPGTSFDVKDVMAIQLREVPETKTQSGRWLIDIYFNNGVCITTREHTSRSGASEAYKKFLAFVQENQLSTSSLIEDLSVEF